MLHRIALPLLVALAACGTPADEVASSLRITHGPMLGRLGSDHVGVWARTSRTGEFRIFHGTNPDELGQAGEPVPTALEDDNSGWALIEGLDPRTKYYYEVTTSDRPTGVADLSGHFHTLATADEFKDPANPRGLFNFAFEFACGNNQRGGDEGPYGTTLPVFGTMLSELVRSDQPSDIDFAILNGDWLYEEKRDYSPRAWRGQVGIGAAAVPRPVRLMPHIVGVWENYKLFLDRSANLAAWHRNVPSYFTFDDHEILNDVYGTAEVGRRNSRTVFRDIGVQAWYDYLGWSNELPATQDIVYGRARFEAGSDILTDISSGTAARFSELELDESLTLHVHWGDAPEGAVHADAPDETGDPNSRVYAIVEALDDQRLRVRPAAAADGEQTYSIGRVSYFKKSVSNVDFLFLDTRSSREMHETTRPANLGKSMIGRRQRQWLKSEMAASEADFFFVISSVNFVVPHTGGNNTANRIVAGKDEAWTVFSEDRDDLIEFWDSLGKPVFVLTGDLHNSFAIKITERVWEFASGPHNSGQHPLTSEGNRQPNGPFEYQGRKVDIRWSSFALPDTPDALRNRIVYCVVNINNAFLNKKEADKERWVAYPRPQAIFQYHDGRTGKLLYAESVLSGE